MYDDVAWRGSFYYQSPFNNDLPINLLHYNRVAFFCCHIPLSNMFRKAHIALVQIRIAPASRGTSRFLF